MFVRGIPAIQSALLLMSGEVLGKLQLLNVLLPSLFDPEPSSQQVLAKSLRLPEEPQPSLRSATDAGVRLSAHDVLPAVIHGFVLGALVVGDCLRASEVLSFEFHRGPIGSCSPPIGPTEENPSLLVLSRSAKIFWVLVPFVNVPLQNVGERIIARVDLARAHIGVCLVEGMGEGVERALEYVVVRPLPVHLLELVQIGLELVEVLRAAGRRGARRRSGGEREQERREAHSSVLRRATRREAAKNGYKVM